MIKEHTDWEGIIFLGFYQRSVVPKTWSAIMCDYCSAAILQILIGSENKYDAQLTSDWLMWMKWLLFFECFWSVHLKSTTQTAKTKQQPHKKTQATNVDVCQQQCQGR